MNRFSLTSDRSRPKLRWIYASLLAAALAASSTAHAADDGVTVVTYGTSLTQGGGWQQTVQDGLQACAKEPVTVVNLGLGGSTVDRGLRDIQQVVDAKPNVVVVEFAINDAYRKHRISVEDAADKTRKLIADIKAKLPAAKIFLMTTNRTWGQQARYRPELEQYYENYRRISATDGVGLIDTESAWGEPTPEEMGDGLHPKKSEFRRVLAPEVIDALKPDVCKTGKAS